MRSSLDEGERRGASPLRSPPARSLTSTSYPASPELSRNVEWKRAETGAPGAVRKAGFLHLSSPSNATSSGTRTSSDSSTSSVSSSNSHRPLPPIPPRMRETALSADRRSLSSPALVRSQPLPEIADLSPRSLLGANDDIDQNYFRSINIDDWSTSPRKIAAPIATLHPESEQIDVLSLMQEARIMDEFTNDNEIQVDDEDVAPPVSAPLEEAIEAEGPVEEGRPRRRNVSRLNEKIRERFRSIHLDEEILVVPAPMLGGDAAAKRNKRRTRMDLPSLTSLLNEFPDAWKIEAEEMSRNTLRRTAINGAVAEESEDENDEGVQTTSTDMELNGLLEGILRSEIDLRGEQMPDRGGYYGNPRGSVVLNASFPVASRRGTLEEVPNELEPICCARCELPIVDCEEIFSALDTFYHPHCFLCFNCGRQCSIETFFVAPDEMNIFCEHCYSALSPVCQHCGEYIDDEAVMDEQMCLTFHSACYAAFARGQLDETSTLVDYKPPCAPLTDPPPAPPPSRSTSLSHRPFSIRLAPVHAKSESDGAAAQARSPYWPSANSPSVQWREKASSVSFTKTKTKFRKLAEGANADRFGFTDTEANETRKSEKKSSKLFSKLKRVKRGNPEWSAYIDSLHDNLNNIKPNKTLKSLIRHKGIPPKLREPVWVRITSVWETYQQNMNCYESILSIKGHANNLSTSQIEKDIHRTFPNNVYFNTDEGRQSLFRVLHAFSWVNPEIGYCQSMNFLAGLLLLFVGEETAFWLISTIVEELLPRDYYTADLIGIRVDTGVFNLLLEERLPQVLKHVNGLGIDLTMFTTQWFLCLFINYLPNELCIWFMDCFLSEGNKMLFRVALALFAIHKSAIMKAKDEMKLMDVLRALPRNTMDQSTLIEYSFHNPITSNLKREHIEHLRAHVQSQLGAEAAQNEQNAPPPMLLSIVENSFFYRPSGEAAKLHDSWSTMTVMDDYSPLATYRRLSAAERRVGLALVADNSPLLPLK